MKSTKNYLKVDFKVTGGLSETLWGRGVYQHLETRSKTLEAKVTAFEREL